MIQVVIADDIQILRQGLKAILSQDPEIEVTGLASNGKEALECCKGKCPHVVLMDMRMPQYDGSWGIRRIKSDFPTIKILVLTTFDDTQTVEAAVGSGADGYVLKEMEDSRLLQSVKAVCGGIRVFGDSVFEGLRRQMIPVKKQMEQVTGITDREREIMRCVARGMDNKEIAAELFLAEGTVRNNISKLLEKLKLKDRTQLAVFTVKNQLD